MALICFCILRPVCPSLPQLKSRTITGYLFATLCTDTPPLFSYSASSSTTSFNIAFWSLYDSRLTILISAVDGDKAWSTIFIYKPRLSLLSRAHFLSLVRALREVLGSNRPPRTLNGLGQ